MNTKLYCLLAGPLLAILTYFCTDAFDLNYSVCATLAITIWVATWWVTEALPIPVTSILPFVLFPAVDVLTHKEAAAALGSHVIILLMGAFMLAKGVEKSGVHHRLALGLISILGVNCPKRVVMGFMVTAAFLSMWISNTATTLMLLPIALAVVSTSSNKRFSAVLMLGIAYAANIGGMGTPIGTPPNIIFMGIFEEYTGRSVSFVDWMMISVPIIMCAIPLVALWLTRGLTLNEQLTLPTVGKWTTAEKRVLCVFALAAFAWIFRQAPFGGWSRLIDNNAIGDSTVALAAVVLMTIIPDGKKSDKEAGAFASCLLDWKTASSIPWGMLLLFAGGICIAKAFQVSGVSTLMGEQLTQLTQWPVYLMILMVCIVVIFLTEVTSNTATTTLLMPVLAVAAITAGIDPQLLMIPAALGASCAFMLPVATAPNAIVYGTERFSINTMVKEGFVINLLMVVIVSVGCFVFLT